MPTWNLTLLVTDQPEPQASVIPKSCYADFKSKTTEFTMYPEEVAWGTSGTDRVSFILKSL